VVSARSAEKLRQAIKDRELRNPPEKRQRAAERRERLREAAVQELVQELTFDLPDWSPEQLERESANCMYGPFPSTVKAVRYLQHLNRKHWYAFAEAVEHLRLDDPDEPFDAALLDAIATKY